MRSASIQQSRNETLLGTETETWAELCVLDDHLEVALSPAGFPFPRFSVALFRRGASCLRPSVLISQDPLGHSASIVD